MEERKMYSQYVKETSYEPTVDLTHDFSNSSSLGRDLSQQKSNNVRPGRKWRQFQDHFAENWPAYIATGILSLVVYLTYTGRIEINSLDNGITNIKESITDLSDKQRKNTDLIQNLRLDVQKNQLNIQHQRELLQIMPKEPRQSQQGGVGNPNAAQE